MLRWRMGRRNDGPWDLICMGGVNILRRLDGKALSCRNGDPCNYLISVSSSFPNDISASLRTNPDLMRLFGIDIDSRTRTKCLLLRLLIFGIRDCQVPLRDEMCSQSIMGVWRIVRISGVPSASQLRLNLDFKFGSLRAICPSKYMLESPRPHLILCFLM